MASFLSVAGAFWTDIRRSPRRLRRAPGLFAIVVATWALVLAANTTVFSLLDALVLTPVTAREPERLVAISTVDSRTNQPGPIYLDTFNRFREQQRSFSALSMYSVRFLRAEVRGTGIDVNVEGVMPEYFAAVGTGPAVGRFFTDADHGIEPPAVLASEFWYRMFGGDSRVIGETVKLDGHRVTVVGVAAPGFSGLQFDGGSDLFLPLAFVRSLAGDRKEALRAPNIIGQLAPGATFTEARAEVLGRWPAIQAATQAALPPAEQNAVKTQQVAVEPAARGFSTLRREYGPSLLIVMGLSTILLVIAVVNLSGIMFARAMARQHEMAVLLVLGAGRVRVFAQSVADAFVLALCSLAIALPLAWAASARLTEMMTMARATPLARPMTPDSTALLLAAAVASIMGLLLGLLPTWRALHGSTEALRQGRTVARTLTRAGRFALVSQVALSMVLLVGAGLFARVLWSLHTNDAPFRGRDIVWTRLARNPGDSAPLGKAYFHGVLQQLAAIPGVTSVAYSTYFPSLLGFRGTPSTVTFRADTAADAPAVTGWADLVSPGFFSTVGITLLEGRDVTWDDDSEAPAVAIINQSLATKLFPQGTAIGRRLQTQSGAATAQLEIVGVVQDAAVRSIREPHLPVAFRPMLQDPARAQIPMAHVRVDDGVLNDVRRAYGPAVESQRRHFVRAIFTLDEWIDFALLQERLLTGASMWAAALAVLLACLGIYGVLAYSVTARAREIGLRMALGAGRGTVVRMVGREGMRVAIAGILLGILCAIAGARLVRSQLYGVGPQDPWTLLSAAMLFLLVALAATTVPALRASRIDPTDALKQE